MGRYTDDDIRNMSKVTVQAAANYLGIAPMAVSIGIMAPMSRPVTKI